MSKFITLLLILLLLLLYFMVVEANSYIKKTPKNLKKKTSTCNPESSKVYGGVYND